VIATRHEGIPEVVKDGVSGLLVDEGDLMAMAAAMTRMVDEPDLAARLGAAGKRRAAANFTVRHHLEQVSGLIESLATVQS
jgi:glycosyltransferase involved in cell wall biosynthesis